MSHSLLKTIGVKTPISSIAFSPDGAALIIGTENGQIMLQSLRTMNKEANKLTISTEGKRVAAMHVAHLTAFYSLGSVLFFRIVA